MARVKKVALADGSSSWLVYVRDGGRGSKATKRRFSSSKKAQLFLDDFQTEKKALRQGVIQVGSFYDTTFKIESENWLEDLNLRSSPGHFVRSKATIADFNKTFGSLELNRITPEFLAILQRKLKMREGRKSGSKWTHSSVNRYTEAICAVVNFAAAQKRIPFSPVAGFKKLPKNSTEMLFWEEEEARSFLAWASRKYSVLSNKSKHYGRKNYLAYLVALNTGMRAGEIWGLKPHDLIFNKEGAGDTIFVRRQFNRVSKKLAPLKGGVSRVPQTYGESWRP